MSEEEKPAPKQPLPEPVEELVLDLNFVPSWARQPPSADPYAGFAAEERQDRRGSGSRDRRERPARDERRGPGRPRGDGSRDGRSRRPDGPPGRGEGRRPDRRREDAPRGNRPMERQHPPREREPFLPVQVSFLPEQQRLATMVADIRTSQHAFPLPELAYLFLSRPDWHLVKIEANKKSGGAYVLEFYQSKMDGQLYLTYEEAIQSVAQQALANCFVAESVQQEPPSGNFVCVARCRISGELLAPPNHHAHKEAVEELHRSRFSHMTLDDYRRNIETVRDPELVEKWKENWRTQTVYRRKPASEDGEPGEPVDLATARAMCVSEIGPAQVAKVKRAVIPGTVSRSLQEPRFTRVLRAAWAREQKFPASLVRALRGAFRRMGLHMFESKDGAVFVTAITPHPVDPERVTEVIREILVWLKEHPGCKRLDLIAGIRPDIGDDPAKLGEVLQPLTWLIDKGHVIEFHNGTLAVPKDTPT